MLAAVLVALTACQDPTAVDGTTTASIRFIVAEAAADAGVAIDIEATYRRTAGADQSLWRMRADLDGEQIELVAELELAACLSDPARVGGRNECTVDVALSLVSARDVVLDRHVLGPLILAPGVFVAAPPVTLSIPQVQVTTTVLPPAGVGAPYAAAVEAAGGDGAFEWALVAGSLPSGLALSPTGTIEGTPSEDGSFAVTVQASSVGRVGSRDLLLTVLAALEITSSEDLPPAHLGEAYHTVLTATGGGGENVWMLESGFLPDGLALAESGAITGVPVDEGSFAFAVRVTNGLGQIAVGSHTLTVRRALRVVTTELPRGGVGAAYAEGLEAAGGDGAFTWTIVAGTLPPGIGLEEDGTVAGIPTAAGRFAFTVEVASAGLSATTGLTLDIAPALEISSPANLPAATVGVPYTTALAAVGGDGSYLWSLQSGAVPPGLDLEESGQIAGTPSSVGTFEFEVRVTNGLGQVATKVFALTVSAEPQPPVITTSSPLPGGTVGEAYVVVLEAAGGSAPYAWSLDTGSLPPGLSLDPAGEIAGTPTTAGSWAFVIRVAGADGLSSSRGFALEVAAAGCEVEVVFPDPNLEAAVRDAIGIATGPICDTDLLGLTELAAFGRGITDLAGLEHATRLRTLALFSNAIEDVSPLAGLDELVYLDLQNNAISDISPLANLTGLTDFLGLTGNDITDISPLANLSLLTQLNLGLNPITDLSPLSSSTQLTWLRLERISTNDIAPLANLTQLTNLALTGNGITDIGPVANMTQLTELILLDNSIIDVAPLENLTALTYLHAGENAIGDISPLANLTELTRLILLSNQISDISALADLHSLEFLSLFDNSVTDVEALVGNIGLGPGDFVELLSNPLSAKARCDDIPILISRGVTVSYAPGQCP